jgi:hypothetical protein
LLCAEFGGQFRRKRRRDLRRLGLLEDSAIADPLEGPAELELAALGLGDVGAERLFDAVGHCGAALEPERPGKAADDEDTVPARGELAVIGEDPLAGRIAGARGLSEAEDHHQFVEASKPLVLEIEEIGRGLRIAADRGGSERRLADVGILARRAGFDQPLHRRKAAILRNDRKALPEEGRIERLVVAGEIFFGRRLEGCTDGGIVRVER